MEQGNPKIKNDNLILVGLKLNFRNDKRVLEQLKVFKKNNPKLHVKEHLISSGSCIGGYLPRMCIYSDKAKYSSYYGTIDCNK